jgi:hypothetical protein
VVLVGSLGFFSTPKRFAITFTASSQQTTTKRSPKSHLHRSLRGSWTAEMKDGTSRTGRGLDDTQVTSCCYICKLMFLSPLSSSTSGKWEQRKTSSLHHRRQLLELSSSGSWKGNNGALSSSSIARLRIHPS